jgi:[acyl-carrier-protein] S-malonyltransferase
VESLYSEYPDAVKNCVATAGFSVGELTALIFSGALSFEDGIKLVKLIPRFIQKEML